MLAGIFATTYAGMATIHLTISVMRLTSVTERAVVMVVMVCIAVVPIQVPCQAVVMIPPVGVISPVPRTIPCVPTGTPKPIVDYRTIDINRLDDIVGTIYILIADDLNRHLLRRVFLYVDRSDILVDILCEDCLQYDHTLIALAYLYYADIIYVTIAVQVQVVIEFLRVVEFRLKLFQVSRLSKEICHHLEVESLGDVGTVGRNGDCLVGP